MSIRDWGYDGPAVLDKGALPARVLGTWGDYYRIVCDKGEGIARKKASAYFQKQRRAGDAAPSRGTEGNAQEIPAKPEPMTSTSKESRSATRSPFRGSEGAHRGWFYCRTEWFPYKTVIIYLM